MSSRSPLGQNRCMERKACLSLCVQICEEPVGWKATIWANRSEPIPDCGSHPLSCVRASSKRSAVRFWHLQEQGCDTSPAVWTLLSNWWSAQLWDKTQCFDFQSCHFWALPAAAVKWQQSSQQPEQQPHTILSMNVNQYYFEDSACVKNHVMPNACFFLQLPESYVMLHVVQQHSHYSDGVANWSGEPPGVNPLFICTYNEKGSPRDPCPHQITPWLFPKTLICSHIHTHSRTHTDTHTYIYIHTVIHKKTEHMQRYTYTSNTQIWELQPRFLELLRTPYKGVMEVALELLMPTGCNVQQ